MCADLAAVDAEPADGRVKRWEHRIRAWGDMAKTFRAEGFYERFPAKGQVERVARMVDAPEDFTAAPALRCANCGWAYDSPDRFCRHCGKPLGTSIAPPHPSSLGRAR